MLRAFDSQDRDVAVERERESAQSKGQPISRQPENPTRPAGPKEAIQPAKAMVASREREPVELRGYRYQISPAELEIMREIGRFRIVPTADLARYAYGGNDRQMREDVGSLRAQGLVQERTVYTSGKGKRLDLIILTKVGKSMLMRPGQSIADQAIYAGFVKRNEVAHDAAIYRMYQAEAKRIEEAGGRIRRVILDYEIKQRVYRPLAKIRPKASPSEYARQQAQVAAQNQLKVVQGKILLPDLRIEYETPGGGSAHVDLELATHHYRGSQMRGKAQAGFKMYAPQDSGMGGAAAFDPEFAAQIFSF